MLHVRHNMSHSFNDVHPCTPIQFLSFFFSTQDCGQATSFKVLIDQKLVSWMQAKTKKFHDVSMLDLCLCLYFI